MTEINSILRESLEKYQFLINNIVDIIVEIDLDGIFTYISPKVYDMLGYRPEEIIGKHFFSYIHPDDMPIIIESFEKAVKEEVIIAVESRFKHKEGHYITVFTKGSLVEINDKVKIVGVLRDIREKKIADQKIMKSEETFRFLYENAPLGYQSLDSDGNILIVNNAWLDFFGYSEDEVTGKWFGDFLEPKYVKVFESKFPQFKKAGEVRNVMFEIVKKDGSHAIISFNGKISYDENKNFKQTHYIFQDVTEYKKAEQELEKEREKVKLYLDMAGVILIALNSNGEVTMINKKGCEVLEYKEKELIGKNWFLTCLPDSMKNKVYEVFNKLISGEIEATEFYENPILTKNGKEKIIAWHNTVLYNNDGNIIGTLSSGEDITERKIAVQRLKESETKYRDLFENSPSVIVLINPEGKIVDCNNAIESLSGYSKQDMIGKDFLEFGFFQGDMLKVVMKNFKFLIGGERLHRLEIQLKKKDGTVIWIMIRASIIRIGDQMLAQVIMHDITKRKKAEQELKEISQIKTELIERTSHELKTPLISIKGFTELLLDLHKEKFDGDVISILGEIKHGTERLETIINRLLESSLLESGKIQFKPSKEDISFLIRFCVKNLRGLAKTRNHFIKLDIPDKLILNFEKERIYKVITHLIINAIKYTPPYGEIKIQTEKVEDYVIVSVQDNGIGLSEDEQKKLFKQFGKIERYGQGWDIGTEGTGMGLYTSKKIVELHGGEIWVESEGRNKGAKFCFSLPINKN